MYHECQSTVTDVFAMIVILAAMQGGSLDIRSLSGDVLRPLQPAGPANVLIFTATDCPVSNGYAPEIQRVCSAYAARGVRCVLVYEDVDVAADRVRAHVLEFGYGRMSAALDADGRVAASVGATVTPEVAIVDHAGAVRYRGRIDNKYETLGRPRRNVTVHDVTDALDAVLDGRRVAAPETQAVGCSIVPLEMRRKKS